MMRESDREPQGFAAPVPRVVPRRCTKCGVVDLTVFLPLAGSLGARLCHTCLVLVNRRRIEVAGHV